jgi:SAM-dependent methyltransferase
MPSEFPIPPLELASRIGGGYEDYGVISAAHRRHIDSMLPADWTFSGKRVLDFGCGTGRTLTAYVDEADNAEFWGCDIHAPSIEWANQHLSPPFHFFVCEETPPLNQSEAQFDLVYAMSVFTHITDQWSAWLLELHRVMRPGGVAVISILGPAMAQTILGRDWDERIGMAVVDLHKGWEIGGPSVLLSEWWIHEHWGRAFEILRFEPYRSESGGAGHSFVAMRKRDVDITVGGLEQVRLEDPREQLATTANLELLSDQLIHLGAHIREREAQSATREAQGEAERRLLVSERDRLANELAALRANRGWHAWRRRIGELSRR